MIDPSSFIQATEELRGDLNTAYRNSSRSFEIEGLISD